LLRPKIAPDVANARFAIEQPVAGAQAGLVFRARLRDSHGIISEATCVCGVNFYPRLDLPVPEKAHATLVAGGPAPLRDRTRTGGCGDGQGGGRRAKLRRLAQRVHRRLCGETERQAGLPAPRARPGLLCRRHPHRPTDAALARDIKLSLDAGFNGARLHQKVFEERFLYHADRLGYLVWGEFSDWGLHGSLPVRRWHQDATGKVVRSWNHSGPDLPSAHVTQWIEAVQRDFNHPSIIGWCPLNETESRVHERITAHDDVMRAMFLATKLYDPPARCSTPRATATACPRPTFTTVTTTTRTQRRFAQRHAPAEPGSAVPKRHADAREHPVARPAVFRERVWRHLVESARKPGRRLMGLRRPAEDAGGILSPALKVSVPRCSITRACLATATRS
jgi:hypothetical protein